MGGTHRKKGKSKKEDLVAVSEKDLDRFAGSSDDDDEDDDEIVNKNSDDDDGHHHADQRTNKQGSNVKSESNGEVNVKSRDRKNTVKKQTQKDENTGNDDDSGVHADADEEEAEDDDKDEVSNDESSQSSDSDDNLDDTGVSSSGAKGMASAMARILGTKKATETAHPKTTTTKKQQLPSPSETSNLVVLSKTKTPLQRMAEQEKQKERQMREKRRLNRERHLAAMHTPLSVATTAHIATAGSRSVAKELEQERMHRRVATRGVVALFNAIAQHQKGGPQQQQQQTNVVATTANTATASGKNTSSKMDVKKMTKHSFLDMIKSKAVSQVVTGEDDLNQKKKTNTPAQWNALRDDYMLDSKKQWDDDENNSDAAADNDNNDEQPIDYSTDEDIDAVGAGIEHENAYKRKSAGKPRTGKKKQRV